jgi:hypothetical protein
MHMSPDVLHPPQLLRRDQAIGGKPCLCRVHFEDGPCEEHDHALEHDPDDTCQLLGCAAAMLALNMCECWSRHDRCGAPDSAAGLDFSIDANSLYASQAAES